MSKDQKKTVEMPVEIVDKITETLNWISTTIHFWKMGDMWPCNLIADVCQTLSVSVSHIIDK